MGKEEIGNKLRQLRTSKSMTVEDVLEKLHQNYLVVIRPNTLYGYENGRTSPDVDVFLALCSIYNCNDILYEFGYSNPKDGLHLNNDERDVLNAYRSISLEQKNMIRGALDLKKNVLQPKSIVLENDTNKLKANKFKDA